MDKQSNPRDKRGLTAIDGALALIALLLIVQMWLLTATLESYLAGHHEVVVPAAIISGLLFLVCAGLYFFVRRIDAEARLPFAKNESRTPHE
jgi:predicted Co/Zn/Cd cation transporter (cation efflux family)